MQVSVPAQTGEMGILANHVPSVEALQPGLVEVVQGGGQTSKYFISSGFASVHPNNSLTINAVEAYELGAFDINVRIQFNYHIYTQTLILIYIYSHSNHHYQKHKKF